MSVTDVPAQTEGDDGVQVTVGGTLTVTVIEPVEEHPPALVPGNAIGSSCIRTYCDG